LKGLDLELAHRNSQASVPFALSSLGYGILWNNPGIGRAVFGKNIMSFESDSTKQMDYWITAGETPAEIIATYANVTGKVPMMPDYAMGFWQCKLRYQNQEELLQVAREYKKRNLPISVIAVDFFHWPKQGEWKFDPVYWPDPDGMIRELKEMGIELMVSIWPAVDKKFDNYRYYLGPNLQIGNIYPVKYAQTFFEGQEAAGQRNIINLLRYAWAGSQKYGALVWSGDIASSFESLRNQLAAGLNMGLAGIPWWTTDIGGFHGGNPNDPSFQELLIR
jgi:alpha-D-xyloside xylohydrolase